MRWFLDLPYIGDALSMVILLPRQADGLGQLEKQLSPAFLEGLLAQMKKQEVEIVLPKFKLESSFTLSDTLAKMGMPDAFNAEKADFSGLNGRNRDLYISDVFHKAWVEVLVCGGGTTAAAGFPCRPYLSLSHSRPPFRQSAFHGSHC